MATCRTLAVGLWILAALAGPATALDLVTIKSKAGPTAKVARSAAPKFQAFIDELEATGYRIRFMGGWRRHGSCRGCVMHPRGLALDINQTARNRVTDRFPAGIGQMAKRHGLFSGGGWRSTPDTGHFEVLR